MRVVGQIYLHFIRPYLLLMKQSYGLRTDIPSFYSTWLFERIREGYICVRNPMNYHQVSRVILSPDNMDGIVFWTKNPTPMLPRLGELDPYMYVFQYSITPYGKEIEPSIPSKREIIIPAFQKLSEHIGPKRVIWRYDPIFISQRYSVAYHVRAFGEIARALKGYTRKCIISFMDMYKNTSEKARIFGFSEVASRDQMEIAREFSAIARDCGMQLETCAEEIDFSEYRIGHARCIDGQLFEDLLGRPLSIRKDKNQRLACGCAASVDIGRYNTCKNFCQYYYANYNAGAVEKNALAHHPDSAFISGGFEAGDIMKEK